MKKIHLICNAHIDPIWQWTYDEGISSAIATFKSACDLADKFDYIFCHNESLLYEAIENTCPELFERIKELVKKGKWKIMGGWYLQPDCVMTSGESLIRQIDVGQKYFMQKFGVKPTVATSFDCFGQSIGLVQILKKTGHIGYVFGRPYKWEVDYPQGSFYKWTSPSGDSIICANSGTYANALGKAAEKILKEVKDKENVDFILWGVGNHGGGPSRKDLTDIENLKIDGVEISHSSFEELFADNIKISADINYSLVPSMPGCYSSMANIKAWHRECENLVYSTEKMLSVASLKGLKIDMTAFNNAIKKMLLSEFHDTLPGTCIEDAEKNTLELLGECKSVVKDYRLKAFMYLVMQEPVAKQGEYPIYVFNPMPYEIEVPIEAEYILASQNWSEEYIFQSKVFCEDKEIASQEIKEESTLNIDWRKKVVFNGKLKPMDITRFSVYSEKVENEHKFDREVIPSSIEKIIQNTILKEQVELVMYDDTADPWGMSKEEILGIGRNPQSFRLMSEKECQDFICSKANMCPIHEIEDGDIYKSVEAFYVNNKTDAVVEYKKYKSKPYIDLKVTVQFNDKNKAVKLKVPVPDGVGIGDGPFIVEEKPNNIENYCQKWVGVKQADGKVFAVINDKIHSCQIKNNYIHLVLLRGAGYSFHPTKSKLYPTDRYLPRIDSGRYVFNFRIMLGSINEISCMSEIFNQKPYAISVFPLGGNSKYSDIHTDKEVNMTTMKISDSGYVFRFFNPEMQQKEFTLFVNNDSQKIILEKMEVISVKYLNSKFEVLHDKLIV